MPKFPQVEGFVLVGGKSSRMGRDKALLEIGGKSLLSRAVALLTPLVASVTLVGDPDKHPDVGLPVISDNWPGAGPLGAIATALAAAKKPQVAILACDLPYLIPTWLEWLFTRAVESASDITVPESASGLESLCAVYKSSCARAFTESLNRGGRKVTDAFEGLNVNRIPENDWRKFSPTDNLFRNLNTWEDYLAAKSQLEIE